MGYRNLAECIDDLERHGRLVAIESEIDPRLEAAAIQRRLYAAQGPAVLFRRVKGTSFPMVGNLFGTLERTRFLFRDTLDAVRRLVLLRTDPAAALKRPWGLRRLPLAALRMLPRTVRRGPILARTTTVGHLPRLVSWPGDGGPFVTLPQVYTEDPDRPGLARSNLGMYRVQLGGNQYEPDREVGLHYQIHRGIGAHHAAALRRGEPLRVNVVVGGPPALAVAAVMPLPEGMSELGFAGVLAGRRLSMVGPGGGLLPMPAEADFVIAGRVVPGKLKPEGPFGDHLGYYSLAHDFPVLDVERVFHRPGAIWPFTSVGRPPQEDTSFGDLIHELTGPVVPTLIPGLRAVHAVDAAGVHPLLLAIGSERYTPFEPLLRPQELLTTACAILGQGQLSLAKYLFIVAGEDDPALDIHDVAAFLRHLLERVDWTNDLHFLTRTTIDTLDYSGDGLNRGSKLIVAAAGPRRRDLPVELPPGFALPAGLESQAPRVVLPGVLAVQGTAHALREFTGRFRSDHPIHEFALVVLVDDAGFVARSVRNFLWVVFTRSNPAADIDGFGRVEGPSDGGKHWGCRGPLVIDARIKPHHAPPLVDDPEIERRVDALGAPGGPLHGLI